jgi:hypothetical protein
MSIPITPGTTDNPIFIEVIRRTIERLDHDIDPDEVFVIKIKNWFDHKWLKFSGIGRVYFDNLASQPQVALAAMFREKITFPPFAPNRVLLQQRWAYDTTKPRRAIHRTLQRESSSWNLQRRVTQFANSALFVWFSSGTKSNDRGSLMVYQVNDQNVSTWYASFRKVKEWKLDRAKGISLEAIESLTQTTRVVVPFHQKRSG